ncbi:MAG: hypothetical protein RLZZ621_1240 [Gemmatimonadota bacterium]|jgi:uncharacterized membrane protein YdjX (TVP38/TMEM64 family)
MGPLLRELLTRAIRFVGLLVPLGIGLGASKLAAPYLPAFTDWIHTLGAWAPTAFVFGYVLASVLMMPAFLLTIASGAVFGVTQGSILVAIGSTLGAVVAFLLGRFVLRDWVARQVARHPTLVIVDRVVGQQGFRLMFLLRLSGIVPFVLTNYAMGVTTVTLRDFVLALIGMIPTIVTYATLGHAGAGTTAIETPTWVIALGIGAAILLGITATRIVKQALQGAEASAQEA